MNYFEELRNLGVDVDAGLERVMDDESFYEMTLDMFIDSINRSSLWFIMITPFFMGTNMC